MSMLSRIHFGFMAPCEQKNLDKVLSFDLSFGFKNSNTLSFLPSEVFVAEYAFTHIKAPLRASQFKDLSYSYSKH